MKNDAIKMARWMTLLTFLLSPSMSHSRRCASLVCAVVDIVGQQSLGTGSPQRPLTALDAPIAERLKRGGQGRLDRRAHRRRQRSAPVLEIERLTPY